MDRNATVKGRKKYPNQLKSNLFFGYLVELSGRVVVPLLPFVVAVFVFPTAPFYTTSNVSGRIVLFVIIYISIFIYVVFFYSRSTVNLQWAHAAFAVAVSDGKVSWLDRAVYSTYEFFHNNEIARAIQAGDVSKYLNTYLDSDVTTTVIRSKTIPGSESKENDRPIPDTYARDLTVKGGNPYHGF